MYPTNSDPTVAGGRHDTSLRVEALNFALRYNGDNADQVVQDAEKYLAFLMARVTA